MAFIHVEHVRDRMALDGGGDGERREPDQVDHRLPTEEALCRYYRVSRGTVRRAIAETVTTMSIVEPGVIGEARATLAIGVDPASFVTNL